MNITTDNYEAYLLDYMEGNLAPDETEQLKAFVTAQGLDWSELTEALPHLDAPQIEFEDKESLKKKAVVVPLYVKIASAAAAAGLLLTIGLWPDKQLPKVEPVATLRPIEARLSETEASIRIIPRKSIQFAEYQNNVKKESERTSERISVEAVAPMSPMKSQETLAPLSPMKPQEMLALSETFAQEELDLDVLRYPIYAEQALAYMQQETLYEEEMPTSWIGRGIYRMTQGRRSSIGGLINEGLHIAKKEATKTATDMTMTAYYRADERFQETRGRWEGKLKQ